MQSIIQFSTIILYIWPENAVPDQWQSDIPESCVKKITIYIETANKNLPNSGRIFIWAAFINSRMILDLIHLAFGMNTEMEMCYPSLYCLIIQCITAFSCSAKPIDLFDFI